MPSSTKKQARTMQAAAHNPGLAKKLGIPQKVAREFQAADRKEDSREPKGKDTAKEEKREFKAFAKKRK